MKEFVMLLTKEKASYDAKSTVQNLVQNISVNSREFKRTKYLQKEQIPKNLDNSIRQIGGYLKRIKN